MGKKNEEVVDTRTTPEKIQDIVRDVFIGLFILLFFILPTAYIGIRSFQPMTIPGYENSTYSLFLVDQFTNHLGADVQQVAFLKILIAPCKSAILLLSQELSLNSVQTPESNRPVSILQIPDVWWTGIQEETIAVITIIRHLYPQDYKD